MLSVVSVRTMREADEKEIKNGTPSKTLMLRAGRAVVEACPLEGRTAIVCGTGNNAGDGYVIANELSGAGKDCTLFLLCDKFSPDGKYYFDICKKNGVKIDYLSDKTELSGYDNIVDCIFGTGYKGTPNKFIESIFEKINKSGAFIVSVDINSGINGDNGLGDVYVKSDITVSIGTMKYGHILGKGKDVAKKYINADIGIPTEPEAYLTEASDFRCYVKKRNNHTHKGTYGTVGIIGGCINYSGAVKLASSALSALRSGCGISRTVISDNLVQIVAPQLKESTLFPVKSDGRDLVFVEEEWENALRNLSSAAIGMGWGKSEEKKKALRYVIENFDGYLVIDADGLNLISEDNCILRNRKAQIILTPHVGEMAKLAKISSADVLNNPIAVAKKYASQNGVIVLLKGTSTVITDGTRCYLVNRGTPGMATAGSGDVLSGIIAGILGEKREDVLLAVAYAAFVNGVAGESAAEKFGEISMLSSDTVAQIPSAIIYLIKEINKFDKTIKV